MVDECHSTKGCDAGLDYQPPGANNSVDAIIAVWKTMGMLEDDWDWFYVTWSDA